MHPLSEGSARGVVYAKYQKIFLQEYGAERPSGGLSRGKERTRWWRRNSWTGSSRATASRARAMCAACAPVRRRCARHRQRGGRARGAGDGGRCRALRWGRRGGGAVRRRRARGGACASACAPRPRGRGLARLCHRARPGQAAHCSRISSAISCRTRRASRALRRRGRNGRAIGGRSSTARCSSSRTTRISPPCPRRRRPPSTRRRRSRRTRRQRRLQQIPFHAESVMQPDGEKREEAALFGAFLGGVQPYSAGAHPARAGKAPAYRLYFP